MDVLEPTSTSVLVPLVLVSALLLIVLVHLHDSGRAILEESRRN